MASPSYDAIVIGAGPGGYPCAIRMAQLGLRVCVVDRGSIGGVCLNWGCIPSKALIHVATTYERMQHATEMGLSCSGVSIDWAKVMEWKNGTIQKLTGGIKGLFKSHKIDTVIGVAKFTAKDKVRVETAEGPRELQARNVVIATGARPVEIPTFKFDGKTVISSKEALELERIPKSLVLIGGGVIGLEIGTFYAKLGTQVTVVEMMPQLLPGIDPDLVQIVARGLRKRNVTIHTKAQAKGVVVGPTGAKVTIGTEKGDLSIEAEKVLVAVGIRPNTDGLDLEKAGVLRNERGFLPVNERRQTNVPGVYAIGDVTGGFALAHKATKEGIVAAESIAGKKTAWDVRAMPAAIFTDPEIAVVGMTDTQAEQAGHEVKIGKFPFAASGRALSTGESEGYVKIVTDAKTDRILGVHIVGPEASNLIAEATLAMEVGATAEDLSLTVHAHPTLPEVLMEASEAVHGLCIHVFQKEK